MLKHGNRSKVGVLIKMDHPEDSFQLNKLILDKDKYLRRVKQREASEFNKQVFTSNE